MTNPYEASKAVPPALPSQRGRDQKIAGRWLTVLLLVFLITIPSFFFGVYFGNRFSNAAAVLLALSSLGLLLIPILSSVACAYSARSIGKSPFVGALFGFFFHIFAVLTYEVVKSGTSNVRARVKRGETGGLARCPNCESFYDPSEYRQDLKEVRCSFCKHPIVLPGRDVS